ncbi:MAG: tetratricopeptide repeat protein [Vicinamibacterales bacterium]
MFPFASQPHSAIRWVALAAGLALVATATAALIAVRQERDYAGHVAAGTAALDRGDPASAIESLSGAIALRPESMLAYFRRGDAYRRRGELTLALRDLKRATELDPTAPRPLELLGDVDMDLKRFASAAERYTAYLARDERAPGVLYKLALARWREGSYAPALASLGEAERLGLTRPELYYLEALCHIGLQQPREAASLLQRAIEANPAFQEARHELERLWGTLGRPADQMMQLEALVALVPASLPYRLALARTQAVLGQPASAVATLTRAQERFPASAELRLALGRLWLDEFDRTHDARHVTAALDALERAVAAAPSNDSLAELGRAQLAAGRPRTALATLLDASRLRPVSSRSDVLLAEAARRTGQRQIERQALTRATLLEVSDLSPPTRVARLIRLAELASQDRDAAGARQLLLEACDISLREHLPRADDLVRALDGAGLSEEARLVERATRE